MAKAREEIALSGIHLEPESGPMYRQLYDSIRQAILTGRLRPGQRLPATRVLARELGVSRNTILYAFDYLFSEGYLKGKLGSGTYITDTLPEKLLHAPKLASAKGGVRSTGKILSKRGQLLSSISFPAGDIQPFKHGLPALKDFPFHIWAKLFARQMRRQPYAIYGYGDSAGYRPLREAIATYLRTSRAVRCEFGQVIIVNGSQQALDLTARVLLDPGDKACIEDPGYVGARKAFVGAGLQVEPVPLDEEGLNIEKASKLISNVSLIQVTPSHQYPLGVTTSLSRRLQLLEWADSLDAWILEDDYDSEYRFAGRPLSSLQGLDLNNRVIYMGTFSKVLFPALRLGYLVVPPELAGAFSSAKGVTDRGSPLLEQAVLTDFINDGHFGRHLRRMRLLYEARQKALINSVRKHLGGFMQIEPSAGGMHEIGWLADGFDAERIAAGATELGITVTPLSQYCMKYRYRPGLVLGYAAFDESEIDSAIRRLRAVFV